MLTKKIETALNNQVANEAYASSSYLSMASWAETKGMRGTAEFFYAQSLEERDHMLKIVKYINEAGGTARIPAVEEPPAKYKSLKHVFETALTQEKGVTKSIHKIVDLAFAAKDFTTQNFLQWFVTEQHEEECLFQSILDLLGLAGAEEKNLFLLDNEIAKIRAQQAATPQA